MTAIYRLHPTLPLICIVAWVAAVSTAAVAVAAPSPSSPPDVVDRPAIRILPPSSNVEGRTRVEFLIIDRAVARLEATVDGEPAGKRKRPPWQVEVDFASPAREQVLEVIAYDASGKKLGDHALTVNLYDPPLRLRITALTANATGDAIEVTSEVSVPRKASLRQVRFFVNEQELEQRRTAPFVATLARPSTVAPDDYVRVVAELADGRTVEDVELLSARGVSDEVEVNLVQVQTLVTSRNGVPERNLSQADFDVRQRGTPQVIDRVYAAGDLALVLGLVVDASGSMGPVWNSAINAARQFIAQTITDRDRAFVIDFDTQLRLTQAITHDRTALDQALESVVPEGGTALFDAILYGLLQYADEPGRRALVVVTDGLDFGSTADPDRTIDIARRLGVPVYVIALPRSGGGGGGEATNIVHTLKLLTDPSGGRLLRLRGHQGLARAFQQIADELRSQYVITYYTDTPPSEGRRGLEVRVKNRKDLEVRAVLPLDLITTTDAAQSPSQSKK